MKPREHRSAYESPEASVLASAGEPSETKTKGDTVRINVILDADAYRNLKITSARKGLNMSAIIRGLIDDYLAREGEQ